MVTLQPCNAQTLHFLPCCSPAPGTGGPSELEFERKQRVFSFDRGSDHRIHEAHVNAQSGKIFESTIESTYKEAQEASSENGN